MIMTVIVIPMIEIRISITIMIANHGIVDKIRS